MRVILRPCAEVHVGKVALEHGPVYRVEPLTSDLVSLYRPTQKQSIEYITTINKDELFRGFVPVLFEDDNEIPDSDVEEFVITEGMHVRLRPHHEIDGIDTNTTYSLYRYDDYFEIFSDVDDTPQFVPRKALFKYFFSCDSQPSGQFPLVSGMSVILKENCPDMGLLFDADTPYTLKPVPDNLKVVELDSQRDDSRAVVSKKYVHQWFLPYKSTGATKEQVLTSNSEKEERVEHPSHYTWLKEACGVEVIDIARHLDFNLGNVLKYILRAGHKHEAGISDADKRIEDLRKAAFYLYDEIFRLQNSDK